MTSSGGVDFPSRRYTGQIADPETGLYFYNARYYNPGLGRFLSPDTLVPTPGNPQSLNRYSYVENNPVKWTDPSGHFIPGLIGIFVGVLAGALAYEGMLWLGVGVAGALVGAGMVGGAVAGGISAAIAGGDKSFSIMLGAAFAGIAAYAAPPLFAFYAASLGRFGAAMATGATLGAAFGAAGTAITGGNILQGTLYGAVSGAVMAAAAYGVAYLHARSQALANPSQVPAGASGSGADAGSGISLREAASRLDQCVLQLSPDQQNAVALLQLGMSQNQVRGSGYLPPGVDGMYYPDTGEIGISYELPQARVPGVLIHEGVHALGRLWGMANSLAQELAAYDAMWAIDTCLGTANYQRPTLEWIRQQSVYENLK
jgi:RHS repeat-associated protein